MNVQKVTQEVRLRKMEGEALAEWLTQELISLGYEAYPHTLKNVFNSKTLRSPLPNKTLAVLAQATEHNINRRIFTPIDRASCKWERYYDKLTSVERVNSRIDESFGFEKKMRSLVKSA